MPKRKTVETFSLTLIGTDGSHTPIGVDGAPVFHAFHDQTAAGAAMVAAVSRFARTHHKKGKHLPLLARRGEIGDLESIQAVTVTTSQVSAAGELLVLSMHKISRDEICELCALGAKVPRLLNQLTDRRVNA